MGLFDKRDKKRGGKDDFDSPMESIDLNEVSPDRPEPRADASAMAAAPSSLPGVAPAPAAPRPAPTARPAPAAAPPPAPDTDSYGIDKAIELMRTLPSENIQLVVQVVKFSLESVGIKLPVIIEDAIRRQKDLRGRVDVLKGEIGELELEIKQRRDEIERHEADYRETTMVRERLELAEGGKKPEAAPAPSLGAPPPPAAPPAARPSGDRAARATGPLTPLSASPLPPTMPPKK